MRSRAEDGTEDRLWTVNDVAKFLGTSRSWVYGQTAARRIPMLQIGGLVRFEPEAIRRYARGEGAASAVRRR